jgi:hypothetical protein
MAEYKSFGSFTPVYEEQLDRLYQLDYHDKARQAIAVFRAYARHAGSVGTCYPGLRRIMQLTHYSETTIRRALTLLFKHDYIRAHIEKSRARRREELTFQLSPYILWIAPGSIEDSLELWKDGLSHCNVIFNEQPESESESEPSSRTIFKNQNQNQQQQQNSPSKTGPDKIIPISQPQSGHSQPKSGQNQPQSGHSHSQPQSGQNQPQSGQNQPEGQKQLEGQNEKYVPPQLVELGLCRRPFADAEREDYARYVKSRGATTLAQARQLVATYGIPYLKTALALTDFASANGNKIRSRIGFTRYLLDTGIVTPGDEQLDRQTIAGKYADFFIS